MYYVPIWCLSITTRNGKNIDSMIAFYEILKHILLIHIYTGIRTSRYVQRLKKAIQKRFSIVHLQSFLQIFINFTDKGSQFIQVGCSRSWWNKMWCIIQEFQ